MHCQINALEEALNYLVNAQRINTIYDGCGK